MTDRLLTSTEAAAWLGASPTSVKRWADAGELECVRTVGKHRRFTLESLERFSAQRGGPSVATSVSEWLPLVLERNVDAVHGQLLLERSRSESWADVCDRLAPVLTEIGEAWAAGSLRVIDEHLATERIARALARVVDSIAVAATGPTAMLMTVDGDDHTLGLGLAEVALREAGWRTLWSGRSTPMPEVQEILVQRDISLLAVSASSYSGDEAHMAEQMEALESAAEAAGATLVLGGAGAWPSSAPRRLRSFRDLGQVARELRGERASP